MGCGDSVLCASAAQQQSQPADEAVNVDEMNCAADTHSCHKYTYRPNECKTFQEKFIPVSRPPCPWHVACSIPEVKDRRRHMPRAKHTEAVRFFLTCPQSGRQYNLLFSVGRREKKGSSCIAFRTSKASSDAACASPAARASAQRPRGRCAWSSSQRLFACHRSSIFHGFSSPTRP